MLLYYIRVSESASPPHTVNLLNLPSLLRPTLINFDGFAIAVTTADFSILFFPFSESIKRWKVAFHSSDFKLGLRSS